MPFIGFLPTLGNPILEGTVISIFMITAIVLLMYQKNWRMLSLCFLVWMFLLCIVAFPKEIAEMASKLGGPISLGR
ncbi:hypothetical protein [Bacillus thuringiensis]|uniref:Uncharacterized protein n=1 Tax=Bacillus thuringiensis subsp. medellin TaxID=79672 RepID=A0A9X6RDB6_BACTV|nr:hypothetical protein [Bacillus thuringiensis]OUB92176.1 hypothetical protein BK784_23665 [Bacillus thuringiensis serovar medellin]PFO08078.1 hypothetical protein COJ79_28230 [Bacillus thuringiensis]PFV87521.1 hypothetical protein COL06_16220 [Bacillus thuringiensis]